MLSYSFKIYKTQNAAIMMMMRIMTCEKNVCLCEPNMFLSPHTYNAVMGSAGLYYDEQPVYWLIWYDITSSILLCVRQAEIYTMKTHKTGVHFSGDGREDEWWPLELDGPHCETTVYL